MGLSALCVLFVYQHQLLKQQKMPHCFLFAHTAQKEYLIQHMHHIHHIPQTINCIYSFSAGY